jgi:hypothetical protein
VGRGADPLDSHAASVLETMAWLASYVGHCAGLCASKLEKLGAVAVR